MAAFKRGKKGVEKLHCFGISKEAKTHQKGY